MEEVAEILLKLIDMPSPKELNEAIRRIKHSVIVEVSNISGTNIHRELTEISKQNNKIRVVERDLIIDDFPRGKPVTIIHGVLKGHVVFLGDLEDILVYSLKEYLAVAGKAISYGLDEAVAEIVKSSNRLRKIKLFITPGVPCLKTLHLLLPLVTHDDNLRLYVIDVRRLSEYYEKYSKGALPLLLVDDDNYHIGAPSNIEELARIIYYDFQG